MSATLESIRKAARRLPLDKREALVRVLEDDLSAAEGKINLQAVEEAWDAEIATRVQEIKAGKAELIPYDQVEAEMDAFVATLQQA